MLKDDRLNDLKRKIVAQGELQQPFVNNLQPELRSVAKYANMTIFKKKV